MDDAVRELSDAAHKPWRDYTVDSIQNTEEAYRAAGYSEAEAKAIATMSALLPHLSEFRALGKGLNELSAERRAAGDVESAEAVTQWALQIGQRAGDERNPTLLQELVSVAMQRDALKTLDPAATLTDSALTVQQRLSALEQKRDDIRATARESGQIMSHLSDSELAMFFERTKVLGERAAVDWARSRVNAR